VLAFVGAINMNLKLMNIIGVIFTTTNTLFAVAFAYAYSEEIQRTADLKDAGRRFTLTGGDGMVFVERETADARGSTKKIIGGSVHSLEKEWDDLGALIEAADGKETKDNLVKSLPFLLSQMILALNEKLRKINYEEKDIDEKTDRVYLEFEKLLLRLQGEYKKYTKESTPFQKQRIVWSYVKKHFQRGTLRVKEREEIELFEDFCEKYYEDKDYLDKILIEVEDRDVDEAMNYEEVVERYEQKKGWKLLGNVELLCVSGGMMHCLMEVDRLGKKLFEAEIIKERAAKTTARLSQMNSKMKEEEKRGGSKIMPFAGG
jgi:hypothetical protein